MRVLKLSYPKISILRSDAGHRALAHGAVWLVASAALVGCFKAPDKLDNPAPHNDFEVTTTLQKTETIPAKVCAAKIETALKSRREAVKVLDRPLCGGGAEKRKWNDAVFSLTETEPEFPCMDAALREKYGVAQGSNLVPDDHALSPEMATYSFSQVSIAICNKPYIAIARDTKRSLEHVTREDGFDSYSDVRHTLELVEALRGDLPPTFDVVQVLNGDYSTQTTLNINELEPLNKTSIWTFCRLSNGTLYSIPLDNSIYEGPGGLELLKSRLALADEWDGDDACPDDWNESAEKSSP